MISRIKNGVAELQDNPHISEIARGVVSVLI